MPKKYKVFTSAKLIRLLERHGFYVDRSRGSHFVLRNEELKPLWWFRDTRVIWPKEL
ncbi:MAG: hypothetical protein UY17_C0036G0005 [Candidatus Beckwithbacteria bacterium GW2011_GWC2_47_9]|uniref:YcfA family protein n=1 Tax=Candidatus Beckwithbacteria bacterium GW2011_GWC2_47_9 TaxID=1618373 RepID=A0A0G1TYL7_9BACT|nr:MAG: hypothetical protein UY17_C0036G0005 [Candidatus Beckwithbacteria bacterium GW2011_GWC2_47_9]